MNIEKGGPVMKRTIVSVIAAVLLAVAYPGTGQAGPDLYAGDTTIYGGAPIVLQPNVLIIIDTSGSMADSVPGTAYDPATDYTPTTGAKYCKSSSGWGATSILHIDESDMCTFRDATDALGAAYCHYLQMGKPMLDKHYSNWSDFARKNPEKIK